MGIETREVGLKVPQGAEEKVDLLKMALDRLRCSCDTTLGIRACNDGPFKFQAWQRDAKKAVDAFLDAGGREDIRYVCRVLELFLEPKPPYPYLISFQPELLDHVGLEPISGHEIRRYQLSLGKKLGNFPRIPIFRRVLVTDAFEVLGILGNCLSSSLFSDDEKKELWKKYGESAKAGMEFYQRKFVDSKTGLISREKPLTGRQDCILKRGKVCHTNCAFYDTIWDLARGVANFDLRWSIALGDTAQRIRESFNEIFWMKGEGHYADWIDEKGRFHTNFDSLANFQAIVSGLADPDRAERILEFAKRKEMRNKYDLTEAVWPPYEPSVINRNIRWLNHGNYYNHSIVGGRCWTDITATEAMACKKIRRFDEAGDRLEVVESLLRKHGTLHELYDGNGQPTSDEFFPLLTFLPRSVRRAFSHNSCEGFTMALAAYIRAKTSLPEDLL